MSHLKITLDNAVVLEGEFTAAVVTPPNPTPFPPNPNPPNPNPPLPPGYNGTLAYAGQHFPLPEGASRWLIPGMAANFAISVAGGDAPTTVTILDQAGNVAQQPWGGPASQTFPAGAGEQWAQVAFPGVSVAQFVA
jgi:hypothetical protein